MKAVPTTVVGRSRPETDTETEPTVKAFEFKRLCFRGLDRGGGDGDKWQA